MKVYIITLTYLDLPLLEFSLDRFYSTSLFREAEHILIDHLWPIDHWNHRRGILDLAENYGCKVMTPYKNLGAHGGLNWALNQLPIEANDLVITYDGDSNPITSGWDVALVDALQKDHRYAWMSLFIDADLLTKEWEREKTISGMTVIRPANNQIDMMNITGWRYSFLKQVGLIQALYPYYGQVESPMHILRKNLGLQYGYLAHYIERPRPFHADVRYQSWKQAHVEGKFQGNFDEYLKEKQI